MCVRLFGICKNYIHPRETSASHLRYQCDLVILISSYDMSKSVYFLHIEFPQIKCLEILNSLLVENGSIKVFTVKY